MEHLNDEEAMHNILMARDGEPQKVVKIVSDAITEKTAHMINQLFNPPRPGSSGSPRIQQYQLFHPETLPSEVQKKRADGYLELFSVVCKAEEMEIGRLAQADQEQDELPVQEHPELPEEEDGGVFLQGIEEPMQQIKD